MILFELLGTESHPEYQALEVANGLRQYDFISSIVNAAIAMDRRFLSQHLIKSLNFQAIVCLHTNAGEYRPCEVKVGKYIPPRHFQVDALMEDFVNHVNRIWETTDPIWLSCYVLWRTNCIHPFINGNGRTARAACYFVLCVSLGGCLPGNVILPELLRQNRAEYVAALKDADGHAKKGAINLDKLYALVERLIQVQMQSATVQAQSFAQAAPQPTRGLALPPPNAASP